MSECFARCWQNWLVLFCTCSSLNREKENSNYPSPFHLILVFMCIYSIHRQNVNDTITKGSNYWVCLLPKFHTFYVPLQYTSSTDSRGQRSKTRKTKLFFKRSLKIPKNDRNMINNTSNHAFMKRWLKNKHKISNKYVTSNDYQTTFQVLSISRC